MFEPKFTISNSITKALLEIERARGFLDAAKLKEAWRKERDVLYAETARVIKIFIRDINKGHKRDILGTKSVLRYTMNSRKVTNRQIYV